MADIVTTPWKGPSPAVEAAYKTSKPTWRGVVAVYRKGATPTGAKATTPPGLCRVESARFLGFNTGRAIVAFVEPKLVERFFTDPKWAYAYVRAEYRAEDESIWLVEPGTKKEFFDTAPGGLKDMPNEREK